MLSYPVADLILEPMNRTHLEVVLRIEREIYPFPWTQGNFADSIDAGYDALVLPGERDAAISAPQAIRGYAVMMHVLDETHLLNLSIASVVQRQGVGRRLLRQLMRRSCDRGARGMFLEVRPSNGPALALYADEGFVQIGVRRNYYPADNKSREDAIVMRCDLTRGADQDE